MDNIKQGGDAPAPRSLAVPREALRSGGEVGPAGISRPSQSPMASEPPMAAPAPKPVAPLPPPPKPRAVPPPSAADIDDIFSDVKEAAAPAISPGLGRGAPQMARVAEKMAEKTVVETPRQGFKKILITVGIIILFAGVITGGGYWAYYNFLKPKPLNPNLNLNVNTGLNVAPVPEANQPAAEPAAQPVIVDSDNDGLTDAEEQTLGTNPLNPDTDGDRLFDGEEVNVYKTDPLNKDTDGDTYEDGSEVQNGYDPKGPGKLIRIPAGQ